MVIGEPSIQINLAGDVPQIGTQEDATLSRMKAYDKAYFDRWYRSKSRVITLASVRRKAQMVVAIAEHLLERPVRSVLDVGCGEGIWMRPLRQLRPSISYVGIDASEYVVETFGKRRNLHLGRFGDTSRIIGTRQFDVIVSSDVIHYLDEPELDEGLAAIASAARGIVFLEVLSREDEPTGDLRGFRMRRAAWYRERFEAAGLVPCGLQCYIGPGSVVRPSVLDLLPRMG